MRAGTAGDPRLEELFGLGESVESGVRPVVRLARNGPSGWIITAGAIVAAILLFWVLESRRHIVVESPAAPIASGMQAETPQLYVPPVMPAPEDMIPIAVPSTPDSSIPVERRAPLPMPPMPAQSWPQPLPMPTESQITQTPPRTTSSPALVIDAGSAAPAAGSGPGELGADSAPPNGQVVRSAGLGRALASSLANRTFTVPGGTLIPAVLETAFDSTRPGFARAIVSHDIMGFDGKKVLIPRGSRLVGEYQAEVSPGQHRARIRWSRLSRPDGVTIAIDSPAADALGRGGIKADVNTHFIERFADALLQSTIEIGRTIANRRAAGSVVVMPGSPGNIAASGPSERFVPTLKVPAATSISIFVSRDLEFPDGTNQ